MRNNHLKIERIIFIVILLLSGITGFAQKRYGYIDFLKVVQTMPNYESRLNDLESKNKQMEDSLNSIVQEYQDFVLNGLPHNVELDSIEISMLEKKIRTMETEIENYALFAQAEITKAQKTIETEMKELIIKEIEFYSTSKEIICIVDKEAILHCTECFDFTDDFVDYLKRKEP